MTPALRATILLAIHVVLFALATPLLDHKGAGWLAEESERDEAWATPLGRLAVVAAGFNRQVRRPLLRPIEPFQKPFRIAQAWHLYRNGPKRARRLEVRADGQLLFRTGDPAHAWLAPQLRNRRVRPVVETTAIRADATNRLGLTRYIVARVREDFPEVQRVAVIGTNGPFDQSERPGIVIRIVAHAPDFVPEPQ